MAVKAPCGAANWARDPGRNGSPVAHLQDVSRVYANPDGSVLVQALQEIDLEIGHGESLAIMGPSGSGKSTLLNILGCLDRPTSGRFLLDQADVSTLHDAALSRIRGRMIGFVFQAFNLIPELSILENVEVPLFYGHVPRDERRTRAVAMLRRVGLGDRHRDRPAVFSGGQQQRIAIARALVTRPSILLADEPTGNLDSATSASLLDLFDELHDEGLTIIVVTHDLHVADRCDRVIVLGDGRIVRDDRTTGDDA